MAGTTVSAVCLATDAGILDLLRQPGIGHLPDIPGAPSHNLDAVTGQHVHGSVAHVSGQHYFDAHVGQLWDNVRFAAASRRRRQRILR